MMMQSPPIAAASVSCRNMGDIIITESLQVETAAAEGRKENETSRSITGQLPHRQPGTGRCRRVVEGEAPIIELTGRRRSLAEGKRRVGHPTKSEINVGNGSGILARDGTPYFQRAAWQKSTSSFTGAFVQTHDKASVCQLVEGRRRHAGECAETIPKGGCASPARVPSRARVQPPGPCHRSVHNFEQLRNVELFVRAKSWGRFPRPNAAPARPGILVRFTAC